MNNMPTTHHNMPYLNHEDTMPYDKYLEWMEEVWKETKRVLVKGGRLCINIGENKSIGPQSSNFNTEKLRSFKYSIGSFAICCPM